MNYACMLLASLSSSNYRLLGSYNTTLQAGLLISLNSTTASSFAYVVPGSSLFRGFTHLALVQHGTQVVRHIYMLLRFRLSSQHLHKLGIDPYSDAPTVLCGSIPSEHWLDNIGTKVVATGTS